MKTRKLWLTSLTLIVSVALLAACNMPITPTPPVAPNGDSAAPAADTPAPGLSGSACLTGTWEVQALDTFIQRMIPDEVRQQGQVTFKDTSGKILYSFDGQGNAVISSLDFKLNADVQTSILKLPVAASLSGTGSASYTASDNADGISGVLAFDNLDGSQMLVSASMSGMPVLNPTPLNDAVFFGSGDSGSTGDVPFTCQGSTLTLTPTQADIPPVTLTRVIQ